MRLSARWQLTHHKVLALGVPGAAGHMAATLNNRSNKQSGQAQFAWSAAHAVLHSALSCIT